MVAVNTMLHYRLPVIILINLGSSTPWSADCVKCLGLVEVYARSCMLYSLLFMFFYCIMIYAPDAPFVFATLHCNSDTFR